jgi:predicted sugar kinase
VANRKFLTEVVYLPTWWRIVLVIPPSTKTVWGQHEETLIDRIARRPNPDRDKMMELALEIMQSSQKADFQSFCSALDHYMVQAGSLFSSVQGGNYTTPEVQAVVETAVASGLTGVGQSSWGPAVFGFAESPEHAESAARQLQAENQLRDAKIFVTTSMPGPARVRFLNQPLAGGDKELESAS